ncbi:MAG: RsbRD N-terminal domain-containing protein [Desulfamplus sp.]|nr:RsbRD N-terminal domain-containing protein [Desulfamplus sp.]
MVSNQLTDLNRQLELNKEKILAKWFEATISSYPEDTARILGKSKNRFDNPVGSATRQSLQDTFDNIMRMSLTENYKEYTNSKLSQTNKEHVDQNRVENSLDPVIRIRAVQNFSASQAVAFVFELKNIVKSVLGELSDKTFDYRVDLVALAAFNRFMKCRENIFLLKATESKRRVHSAFERAGLVTGLTEDELLGSRKS